MKINEWFASWFDTTYYHLLYKDRDTKEAEVFIHNLLRHLQLEPGASVLDLACGKGRHSKTLNECGMNVLGVDLSHQSIENTKKLEKDGLTFRVHDMRQPIENQHFDAIFNLFTSFGYFKEDDENLHVLKIIQGMLRIDGLFLLDFLNAEKVINNLVKKEKRKIENVQFIIERKYDGTFIQKSIDIDDNGKIFHYEENVRGYTQADLVKLLEKANFKIMETFGSFDLKPFNSNTSDRAIFICKRQLDL